MTLGLASSLRIATLAALCLAASPSPPPADRTDADVERYVWDLSSLYPDEAAWERERVSITAELERVSERKGTLGRNASSLVDGLDEIAALRRRAGRLELYGVLRADADTRSATAARMAADGPALARRVDSAVAFAGPEIVSIGEARLSEWLASEPRLEIHRRRIRGFLREGAHGASATLIADLAEWPETCNRTYWALLESDLSWPTLQKPDGGRVIVNPSTFLQLRTSKDSAERKSANELFLAKLRTLENVFGVLLTRRIQADATIARQRGFRDGIEAQLFREGLPPDAHRKMLEVVHANLATLQRYSRLRARAVGIPPTFDALRAPLDQPDRRITVEESLRTIVAASAPLGPEFQARLTRELARRWVHLPPSPEKRDTYEVFPRVGGAEPFGLMTFREDLRSSRALAGLTTLLVTFASVPPERSFDHWSEDTGVFSNGILEAGRFLHDDYVVEHAAAKEKIAALVHALDAVAGVFFRYALVSEFESRVQERILKGETPSRAELSRLYLDLLREYYGHDRGVVKVDELFAREWITNRVSFVSFETLNFPLAAAAAAGLVEKARSGDAAARRGFLESLGRGEIDLSHPLLRASGVDLTSAGPYEAVIRRLRSGIDALRALVESRGAPEKPGEAARE